MKLSTNAKKALVVGTLCSVSYLAVYIARNVLGAVTPQMVEGSAFTEEYIGKISSLYFICSWNPWLPTSSLQAALPFGE